MRRAIPFLLLLSCVAAADVFQVRYTPTALPQNAEPAWSVDGDAKVVLGEGVLKVDTTVAGTYYFRRDWLAKPGKGAYVCLRLRMRTYSGSRDFGGCALKIADGEHEMILLLRTDGVGVFQTGFEERFDTTDRFHDYRVGVSGTDFFLDVDGKTVFDGKGHFTQSFRAGENLVQFGDLTPQAGASWDLATIAYTLERTKNDPPVFREPGDLQKDIKEGDEVAIDFAATDPDDADLKYASEDLPKGATLDGRTGRFAWTPGAGSPGKHVFTVTASDGDRVAARHVCLAVEHVNKPPRIVQPKKDEGTFPSDSLILFNVRAEDPDGDALTFRVEGLPDGAKFDPATHVFQWTPRADQVGRHVVKYFVSDGTVEVSCSFTFHIEKK